LVKGIFAKRFFKFAGLLVIFFAIFNISNAYNLINWPLISTVNNKNIPASTGVISELKINQQVIQMTQLSNGYSPNKFTVKVGRPVKWIITSENPFSCASSISMPQFNIAKKLVRGENIIEFTPMEIGTVKFTCSMGMYSGTFNVVSS
jgi:uncharacterized protein